MGHVTLTTPVLWMIRPLYAEKAYWCTKFNHSSFSRYKDIVGAHQNLNNSGDLITPLLEMICHLRARTC